MPNILKPFVTAGIIAVFLISFCIVRASSADLFPWEATINGVDVGSMTAQEASEAINENWGHQSVRLSDDDVTLAYEYDLKDKMSSYIKRASFDPIFRNKLKKGCLMHVSPDSGTQNTADKIKQVNKNRKPCSDAHVDLKKLDIVPEVYGKQYDSLKVATEIYKQREENPLTLKFDFEEEEYYLQPSIKTNDEHLAKELEFDKQFIADGFNMIMPDQKKKHFGPEYLGLFLKYKETDSEEYTEDNVSIDEKDIKKTVEKIAKEYSASTITFTNHAGKTISVKNKGVSTSIDVDATAKSIKKWCDEGRTGTPTASLKTDADISKNHIEVDKKKQKVYLYKNGKKVLTSSVVTGMKKGHNTPSGAYSILYTQQGTTLRGYNDDGSKYANYVRYWMPFTEEGIGLHDADWRYEFGGDIYKYAGSHGCVNLPIDVAKKMFSKVDAGYPVLVF